MKSSYLRGICLQVFLLVVYSFAHCQTGVLTVNGVTSTQTGQTISASQTDESAVYVLNSGMLTMNSCTLSKSGNSSDVNTSSQYGLNAGLLVKSSGSVTLSETTVTTNGSGANGIFATGTNSSVVMTGGSIDASGSGAHGVDVTYGGSITTYNVDITTHDDNSSAIATDFGGGTVTVNGGTTITMSTVAGSHSAGIYSTGVITVNNATVTSSADAGGVIDGTNSIILNNTSLTGKTQGVKMHVTSPSTGNALVTISGGSITVSEGDAFYFDGSSGNSAKGVVTVKDNVTVNASTGVLVNAVSPAVATFNVENSSLVGNIISTGSSTINVSLSNLASLSGAINNSNSATLVTLTMDCTSSWTVTATSYINGLITNPCISGASVSNITGNGFNVYYKTSTNPSLNGQTYSLVSGGFLLPEGSSSISDIDNSRFSLLFSPNPFTSGLKFDLYLVKQADVDLTIFDMTGKSVHHEVYLNAQSGSNEYAINLRDNLNSGSYMACIIVSDSDGKHRICKSIIKE